MPRTHWQPGRLIRLARVAIFAALLLAGVLGRAWALPGRVLLGQTIPPPPTFTSTRTVSAEPTATWTPRPTWTRVVTQPPEPSTATPSSVPVLPTATSSPLPNVTPAAPQATPTSLLPAQVTATSPPPRTSTPPRPLPATPTAEPNALAFEVAVIPQAAGPRDAVQFILQVANVGYEPIDDVQVTVVFPPDLWFQSVECPRCTTDCPQCRGGPLLAPLTIAIGHLPAGDQVIAPVHATVADDAWPGRTLRTEWTLVAAGVPAQAIEVNLELPWAPLPATGGQ